MAAQRGAAAECKHSPARGGHWVSPARHPSGSWSSGRPAVPTPPGLPWSGLPILHVAPARQPRYKSILFFRSQLSGSAHPPYGWVTPHPVALPGRFPLWSPRREMLIPCCALPSSSPKGKTPLRSGARHGILLSPRAPGLSQGWAGREERSHHVQLPARPPRPAQPPPARPAEPARLARAGGSRPPPRYNGRRRFRRISIPFPRI